MGSRCFLAVGLGFGDEGKGGVVSALTRWHKAHTVLRFNGGGQCGHNVLDDDGTHHTFAQFGSGTLEGARTHLTRFMLVNPTTLFNEERALQDIGITDAFDRLTIDGDALVTTYWHMLANRERERLRGAAAHGTCGMGIGETVAWSIDDEASAIRVRDIKNPALLASKMAVARSRCLRDFPSVKPDLGHASFHHWATALARVRIVDGDETRQILKRDGAVIFEGAQGVLLDQDLGFSPHVTWSKTTFENAEALIAEAGNAVSQKTRIGILRSYMTRHGAGPLVTESALQRSEPHNGDHGFQGAFRTGELDFPALTYAIRCVAGVDEIAVTHMDRVPEHVCLSYTKDFKPDAAYLATCRPVSTKLRFHSDAELLDMIESELGARVSITSWGPKTGDKRARNR